FPEGDNAAAEVGIPSPGPAGGEKQRVGYTVCAISDDVDFDFVQRFRSGISDIRQREGTRVQLRACPIAGSDARGQTARPPPANARQRELPGAGGSRTSTCR